MQPDLQAKLTMRPVMQLISPLSLPQSKPALIRSPL
jgi:hypothetical protein